MSQTPRKQEELFSILCHRKPLPPLWPKKVWREELRAEINALEMSPLMKGTLHLLNDDLDAAHQIVQEANTPDANYLHALVHRREGDLSNARYWLRTMSGHAVWGALRQDYPDWDPLKFLVWCESCSEGCSERSCEWLQQVQVREIQLLLETLGTGAKGR
jgi:hypothetical protein